MVTDIYYFSGTHWDREWYQTFQGFRHRLVDMTDELIEHLEKDEKFGTYHFDGQTIVLEDYKKIAPENEARLKKLIENGKIKVGPWYNMPTNFLFRERVLYAILCSVTGLQKNGELNRGNSGMSVIYSDILPRCPRFSMALIFSFRFSEEVQQVMRIIIFCGVLLTEVPALIMFCRKLTGTVTFTVRQ